MNTLALQDLSYGMYVIGTKDDARLGGCVVNTVTQVSATPALVTVSVNHQNLTNQCLKQQNVFAVSILAETVDAGIIGKFGFQSGRDADKFAGVPHTLTPAGCPVLTQGVCGWLECKVIDRVDLATHTLFIAEVTDAARFSGVPMTYSYYHRVIKGKSPANAPTYVAESPPVAATAAAPDALWVCDICGYEYDGADGPFESLPEDWFCPLCGMPKAKFSRK
jgi:flavin reductase (DIM6/NTAB) family NADH-FMN oxidoreductase RutF/rubredoxin